MRLSDEEVRAVLARAEEIERASTESDAARAEFEVLIEAAEEVGLTRRAVELAIRERFPAPAAPPADGSLTFARTPGGKFHVAEVISQTVDSIRVRFINGSEHTITPDLLRPFSLMPGERIACHWPWWGPWTCTVIAYDAKKQMVKVTDNWGEERTFGVGEVWHPTAHKTGVAGDSRRRLSAALIAVGAGVGGLVASALTWLLLR